METSLEKTGDEPRGFTEDEWLQIVAENERWAKKQREAAQPVQPTEQQVKEVKR